MQRRLLIIETSSANWSFLISILSIDIIWIQNVLFHRNQLVPFLGRFHLLCCCINLKIGFQRYFSLDIVVNYYWRFPNSGYLPVTSSFTSQRQRKKNTISVHKFQTVTGFFYSCKWHYKLIRSVYDLLYKYVRKYLCSTFRLWLIPKLHPDKIYILLLKYLKFHSCYRPTSVLSFVISVTQ
jgi:hypothetical protein